MMGCWCEEGAERAGCWVAQRPRRSRMIRREQRRQRRRRQRQQQQQQQLQQQLGLQGAMQQAGFKAE